LYAIPSEVKSILVLTLYPCKINEGTTIGHFFPKSTCQALELNTMQEAAPLPPEKDIVPLRRNKMTEEEFQKIDTAKDLTPDQYSKLKALIMVYKDVFCFTPEDQRRYRLSYPPGYKVFTLKPDAKPMRQKSYKMSIKERDAKAIVMI
jgi:hypothetical protein